MVKSKQVSARPMTLTVTVEAGQPVKTRVWFDRPQDESEAYRLSVEAARLAEPLRKLMRGAVRVIGGRHPEAAA